MWSSQRLIPAGSDSCQKHQLVFAAVSHRPTMLPSIKPAVNSATSGISTGTEKDSWLCTIRWTLLFYAATVESAELKNPASCLCLIKEVNESGQLPHSAEESETTDVPRVARESFQDSRRVLLTWKVLTGGYKFNAAVHIGIVFLWLNVQI